MDFVVDFVSVLLEILTNRLAEFFFWVFSFGSLFVFKLEFKLLNREL